MGELVLDRMEEELAETRRGYEKEGKSDRVSEDLAFNDHLSDIRRTLRKTYAEFLTMFMNVQEKIFIFNSLMTTAKFFKGGTPLYLG